MISVIYPPIRAEFNPEHHDLSLEERSEIPLVIDANGNTVTTVADASKYLRAVEKEGKKTSSRKRKAPAAPDIEHDQEPQPRRTNPNHHQPQRRDSQPIPPPRNHGREAAGDAPSSRHYREHYPADPRNHSSPPPEGDENRVRDEEDWGQWIDTHGFERAPVRASYQSRSMSSFPEPRHPDSRRLIPVNEEEEDREYGRADYRHAGPDRRYDSRPPPSRYHDQRGREWSHREDLHREHESSRQPSNIPSSRFASTRTGPVAKKRKIQELDDRTPRRIAPVPHRARSGSRAPRNAIAGPSRQHRQEVDHEMEEDETY